MGTFMIIVAMAGSAYAGIAIYSHITNTREIERDMRKRDALLARENDNDIP
jgi:hypothetical protein